MQTELYYLKKRRDELISVQRLFSFDFSEEIANLNKQIDQLVLLEKVNDRLDKIEQGLNSLDAPLRGDMKHFIKGEFTLEEMNGVISFMQMQETSDRLRSCAVDYETEWCDLYVSVDVDGCCVIEKA